MAVGRMRAERREGETRNERCDAGFGAQFDTHRRAVRSVWNFVRPFVGRLHDDNLKTAVPKEEREREGRVSGEPHSEEEVEEETSIVSCSVSFSSRKRRV